MMTEADLQRFEDWLRPEHKPRCDLCRSPVLLGGDRGMTRWYQSLYQEDVGALVAEVRRLRETVRAGQGLLAWMLECGDDWPLEAEVFREKIVALEGK